jgi:hypothetical protein
MSPLHVFCLSSKQPILTHCMDGEGRFLAVAVGQMGEWDSFDRYSIYLLDTADAQRPAQLLDVSHPQSPDGVGGERFVRMHMHGGQLLVLREERYMHWDGVEEQRSAAPMAFDLASGGRVKAPDGDIAETATRQENAAFEHLRLGDTQADFALISDKVEQCQGQRPEALLCALRTADLLLVDYRVTGPGGVQHFLHVSVTGARSALRVPGMLEKEGIPMAGHFTVYGGGVSTPSALPEAASVVFSPRSPFSTPQADSQLCVIRLVGAGEWKLERVSLRLENSPSLRWAPHLGRFEALPLDLRELLKSPNERPATPVHYLPGISVDGAGGGFLVGAIAVFLLPMLLLFLFEFISVLRVTLAGGDGRWEGVIVFSLLVMFFAVCLYYATRRWRGLCRVAASVERGETPCGLWLLDSHLLYRDRVDECILVRRQDVRSIRCELVGRTQQWLIVIEQEHSPRHVRLFVNAITEFLDRPEDLLERLTGWWQNAQAVTSTLTAPKS